MSYTPALKLFLKSASAVLIVITLIIQGVHAGRTCSEHDIPVENFRNALKMALLLHEQLQVHDPNIAFVARVGSDLSQYGLVYSHAGMLVKSTQDNQWKFIHELNRCETASSEIFDEGLINFFTDTPLMYKAKLIIPSNQLQQNLMTRLHQGDTRALHQPRYSIIANPYGQQYQNSNQWLLELVAMAQQSPAVAAMRTSAQTWLAKNNFKADIIHISAGQRIGAALFRDNVKFDDHDINIRLSGNYPVVTVNALYSYVKQTDDILVDKEFWLDARPIPSKRKESASMLETQR